MKEDFYDKKHNVDIRKIIVFILGIFAGIVLVFGISYAIFNVSQTSNVNSIKTGKIQMNYTESANGISLTNALPMKDDEGKVLNDFFDFSVTTEAEIDYAIPYEINVSLKEFDGKSLSKNDVKVFLTQIVDGEEVEIMEPVNLGTLDLSSLRNGAIKIIKASDLHYENLNTTNYRLRIWIDYNVDVSLISDSSFGLMVNVDSNVSAK